MIFNYSYNFIDFTCLAAFKNVIVVHQFYESRVVDEFVLRGNAATLKCNLPSFVADFVLVDGWISDDGIEYRTNNDDFGRRIL